MPRTVDPVERRARVAAAARAVIARDGLDATSVRRVAAEAGSSTTVVTHYFADKQALLLAAVQDAYAAAAPRMAATLEAGPAGCRRCARCCWRRFRWTPSGQAEARVWMAFWSVASTRPALRAVQRAGLPAVAGAGARCSPRPSSAARWPPSLDPDERRRAADVPGRRPADAGHPGAGAAARSPPDPVPGRGADQPGTVPPRTHRPRDGAPEGGSRSQPVAVLPARSRKSRDRWA